jgi:hypothetical protein
MKKVFLCLVLVFGSLNLMAQDFTSLNVNSLQKMEYYVKAEPKVLECSTFLLNTPYEANNLNRLSAMNYIMKWMEGTDYTFNIDSKAVELTEGNNDLFGLYMTTMPKVVLENKGVNLSTDEIHNRVVDLLIAYCKNEKNNMKPTKKLKKLMK